LDEGPRVSRWPENNTRASDVYEATGPWNGTRADCFTAALMTIAALP
jgi:hypothetical protein